jgi:hypothetical protein
MATAKSTTPSSDSCAIRDAAVAQGPLDFPEQEAFRSLPPPVSLAQMIERSRQLRRWFPNGLRTAAERWQAKTTVVFRL